MKHEPTYEKLGILLPLGRGGCQLGIHYPGTQTLGNTIKPRPEEASVSNDCKSDLSSTGGNNKPEANQTVHQQNVLSSIVPHPRTLRKARLQVNIMVVDGFSIQHIRMYLHRWARWWLCTVKIWDYQALLLHFINACWPGNDASNIAAALILLYEKRLNQDPPQPQGNDWIDESRDFQLSRASLAA